MTYHALKHKVVHGRKQEADSPPDDFLHELIDWGRTAPEEIFEPRGHHGVYSAVQHALGPYKDNFHRRAVMLEVMRVLAGFESTWKWWAGHDGSSKKKATPKNTEAGAWQVSADSMDLNSAPELKLLVLSRVGSDDPLKFQDAMKTDHDLAMEYIARLLRNTINHNGPVKRHTTELDLYLRKDAVREFLEILNRRGSDMIQLKGHWIVPFRPIAPPVF